ncbi:Ppx/GppA family phosphatase [Pseudooceanicola sp. CBS1P-1]|uniref:Exopolyphosphatase n=1 Tax=Pseudooceanicola albus TaxID=2692189 RepID=A0A6L7G2P1_9RHOB|nr:MULTISPECIES: Ppx/GppA family phosphatase [Pseudooceanicola]MBT9384589.1 Ppx/GppA family phosphatase [Pseudooceanicola endophyticus]MXN18291.1 exopolyphosphatase [Pseudooceanicola albus]
MDGDNVQQAPDWGPFGRPLFNDPKTRALTRVGVVDVGSNSVRMVVFDGAARSPAYFFNEKIMCGLGAGLSETGRLNPEGRRRALAAIHRFQLLAAGMDAAPLTTVATAAVREASDGPEFIAEVFQKTGLKIHVIDGREEARLSAQGVLLGWPGSYGLVCDIGGSSMEIARIRDGKVGERETSQLGPLKLQDVPGGKKGRKDYIKAEVEKLASVIGLDRNRLFLVGGSWRAIARIDMERRGYPLHVLHEYRMSTTAIRETVKFIEGEDLDALRKRCNISNSRMSLVPLACEVLLEVLRQFKPHDIAVSSYGIREGMLYQQMPQDLRDRDPLIESCRFAELKDSRHPGFGRTLFNFIQPIFRHVRPERMRLVKAACLLHDVTWRAHPDYRAEVCFDNSTRANLGGLRHSERVFLGLALLHRYKNKREGTQFEELIGLLSEDDIKQAEILGKAMRFGAMIWPEKDAGIGQLNWYPKKKVLELELAEAAWPLYGEVAEARFKSLANALEAEVALKMAPAKE